MGKEGSWFEATSVNVRIMNPYSRDLDPGYEVAIIRGSARAEIDFQLLLDSNDDSKYELVAKLRNVKLEVGDLKTYFDSQMMQTEDVMSEMCDPLVQLFAEGLNKRADEVGLILAKPTAEDLSESKLYIYDGFLMI